MGTVLLVICHVYKPAKSVESNTKASKGGLDGCHLQGVKKAVPKTILQLMNVEGMTRENVASHLQKYRLYLKRLAGYPPAARLPLDTLQQVQQVPATGV